MKSVHKTKGKVIATTMTCTKCSHVEEEVMDLSKGEKREEEPVDPYYELTAIELDLADTPVLSIAQIVAVSKKTLGNLDLTDRKFIVRELVDKIVATQKEATIWGHIPILVTEQVGLRAEHRHSWVA